MVDIERVKKLLGSGVHPAAAASAVGCTAGYISQLLADPEFALAVSEMRLIEMTRAKTIDDTLDDIELELVEKLKDLIPMFMRPKDVMDALVKINAMKRKTKLEAGFQGAGGGESVVKLTVPAIVINNYKINMLGGMVEVEGRKLQPMSSTILMKTLDERRGNGKEPKLLEGIIEKSSRKNEISADSV